MVSTSGAGRSTTPESVGYSLKRLLLGKPLITEQLKSERLSNPVALGVLSPDAISSSAYGTEEILIELLPYAGLAAFTLVLPITGVILLILVLVAGSYRQVVMAYTRAGGSYVVARENFGPRVAQIAAAALLIDYVVTVAVQAAAGTVAVVSAMRPLGPYSLEITVGVVVIMCYANLRGLREAGRPFALPTYFFIIMVGLMIVIGIIREIFWGLPVYDAEHIVGAVPVHQGDGLIMGATLLVVLRAFANGGSSLTGVEAISNTVSVFRKPQGSNARQVLTVMACILGFLVAGVSYLAHVTHAPPYAAGYPSVLSEIARAVFGGGPTGHMSVRPRPDRHRRHPVHRREHQLQRLPRAGEFRRRGPFPAAATDQARSTPGVLQRHHRAHRAVRGAADRHRRLGQRPGSVLCHRGVHRVRDGRLRHDQIPSDTRESGLARTGWRSTCPRPSLSTIVVGIFAIAKFTEGAWLVVVVFPLLVFVLMRLNREYRAEAAILEMFRTNRPDAVKYARHRVFVLVNGVDLAVLEALRYGRGLRADDLTAVHFMIDAAASPTSCASGGSTTASKHRCG